MIIGGYGEEYVLKMIRLALFDIKESFRDILWLLAFNRVICRVSNKGPFINIVIDKNNKQHHMSMIQYNLRGSARNPVLNIRFKVRDMMKSSDKTGVGILDFHMDLHSTTIEWRFKE